jgi:hypothetical protein
MWRQQAAQRRRASGTSTRRSSTARKASKTIAATERQEHAVVLGLLFVFCAAAAAGTFVMAQGVLSDMFPGVGSWVSWVRSLGLVATELCFGHFAYSLWKRGRAGGGAACAAVVLLAALAECGLAGSQGDIAARNRQEAVLKEDAQVVAPASAETVATDIPGGPQKAAEILEAQKEARHEAQAAEDRREAAHERVQAQRMKLAVKRTKLEQLLPVLLALLGAAAAACTTPLLEMLIQAMRRDPQVAPGRKRR